MKRKIIAVILTSFILLIYSCSFVFAENSINETNEENTNQTLEEKQEEVEGQLEEANIKLEYVQTEMSATMLKIQELEDKVFEYQQEIATLDGELTKLETSISQMAAMLTTVEEDYNKKNELLTERLVAMYEAGETLYLDVLLSSRNIVEFISGYFLIAELAEYDNNLIEQVGEVKNNIELTKTKLENEELQLKIVKARKEQTTIVWQNTKTLQQTYVQQLSDAEKILQEQITEYKAEKYRIETLIQEAMNKELGIDIQYTGGEMLWPVAVKGTVITSGYGAREHPIQGVISTHTGLDIGNADFGAPIIAAADGVVTYAGWLGGYGNCVIINHGQGIVTLYGHGQKILVSLDQEVKQGDVIMEVGSTGLSTGPHLHFEVRYNGTRVNPLAFVKAPT